MAGDAMQGISRAVTREQKQAVLARLLALWEAWPNMRFGQLLANGLADAEWLRVVEDGQLLVLLERVYGFEAAPEDPEA